METKNIVIDFEKTLGSNYFVCNIEAAHKWIDGVPSDNIDGWKVTIVLPERSYEKISVKVNEKPSDVIFEKRNCLVYFENISAYFYAINNRVYTSLKADSVRIRAKNSVDK